MKTSFFFLILAGGIFLLAQPVTHTLRISKLTLVSSQSGCGEGACGGGIIWGGTSAVSAAGTSGPDSAGTSAVNAAGTSGPDSMAQNAVFAAGESSSQASASQTPPSSPTLEQPKVSDRAKASE